MLRFASCGKLHHAVPRRIEAPEEHVGGGAPEGLHLSLCLLPRPARLCLDPATQNRDRAQTPVRQYSSQSSAREEAHHPHSGTRQSGKPVRYSPSQASENDRASNSRYEATRASKHEAGPSARRSPCYPVFGDTRCATLAGGGSPRGRRYCWFLER